MKADVLIFGRKGQVAYSLLRAAPSNMYIRSASRPEVDLTSERTIRECIAEHSPRLVVNAAAYTAVDLAETEQELAFSINAEAPRIMAEETALRGIPLIHYSTDYVYSGEKQRPYLEDDPVGPLNVYGGSKLAGDEAIIASGADHVILRTCWLYGSRRQNFLLTMLRLAREQKQIRVVNDQFGSPTGVNFIAAATWEIVRKILDASTVERQQLSGVFHLACSGATTWFSFAEAIFSEARSREIALMIESLLPISSEEYPTPARRPRHSVLSCEKLERTFGIRGPDWKSALESTMIELNQGAENLELSL
ncbi:MAG: dTDP-4-dehydrorhamnose reductase [Acidobacteriaceae bacterium]